MSPKARPARYGFAQSSPRKNIPNNLTPWWHYEVLNVVHWEEEAILRAEREGVSHRDVQRAIEKPGNGGLGRPYFNSEDWLGLIAREPDTVLRVIHSDAGLLLDPLVVDTIRLQRARLKNAIGKAEWEEILSFFFNLGAALMGLDGASEPGFPWWFQRCIRLEYQATLRDVREKTAEYKSLSKLESRGVSLRDYLARELEVKTFEWSTPSKTAISIMAERWHTGSGTIEKWLKPSRGPSPRHRRPASYPRRLILRSPDGTKDLIIEMKGLTPAPIRKGRPPKPKGTAK